MWIDELDIAGFKQLQGAFTFAPGLTLVYGPNEAGKTALQDAILRSWFGFSRGERRMYGGTSTRTQAEPWNGRAFGLNAILRDALDGRSLRVSWNFAEHSVTVRDHDTGEDLSAQVRRQNQNVVLGEWLLGLGLEDYRQACCLFQVALEPIARSDELVGQLRVAVEQGTPDGGVDAADDLLRQFLAGLGFHSGHYRALPAGERARVGRELEESETALEAATAAREDIRTLSADKATLQEQIEGTRSQLLVVEQRLRLTDCVMHRRRWNDVTNLRERIDRRPAEPVVIAGTAREQIAALKQQLETVSSQIAVLESHVADEGERVSDLERQLRDAVVARDRLEAYREWNASAQERVRELESHITTLDDELDEPLEAAPERSPELARFRAERDRVRALAVTRENGPWRRELLIVAGVVTVLAALGATISPVALVGLVIAAVIVWSARPRGTASTSEALAVALRDFDAESLEELERRADEEDRLFALAEGRREERQIRAQRRREARAGFEQQLREVLQAVDIKVIASVKEAAIGYLASCSKHAQAIELQAHVDAIELELNRAREPHRHLEVRQREVIELEGLLLKAYADIGIDIADVDEAGAAYSVLLSRADDDAKILADVRAAEAAMHVVLEGRTPEQVSEALSNAEQLLPEHIAQHGELTREPGDRGELNRMLSDLQGQLERSVSQASAIEAQIEERESDCGDPAELEERRSDLRIRKAQLDQACEAIRIARQGLAKAAAEAHREFAPHLNQALALNLPRVTDGRYARATVGEALEINVIAPETGRLVPVEMLSRGTQDQIALVERLAVAQMLDPTTGHAPLLLDDPFGHTDPDRRGRALELISELAESRQIILTTDDPVVVESARIAAPDVALIELTGPEARDAGVVNAAG